MRIIKSVFAVFPIWVLAMALAAGLLYALPQVLLKKAAEREGRFFVLPNLNHLSDDALYYLPRAHEIYEGHFPSEINYPEYKDKAWFVFPPLPQMVTAGFLWLARGNVARAVIGLIFVFAVINFLCFYAVGVVLLRSRLGAAFLATLALLTHAALRMPAVFYKKGVAMDLIANLVPRLHSPTGELALVRIDDPLLTMPLFLIAFLLLYRFMERQDTKRALALGAAVGTLTYVYLYYWVAIGAVAGIFFLYQCSAACRIKSYAHLKPWGICAAVFGILFVPQIINFFMFRALPGAADYVMRKGIESGRGFRFSVAEDYLYYAILGIVAFFLLRAKTEGKKTAPTPLLFIICSISAMFLLWNMQIITGFNIDADHWWKTSSPLLFILTALVGKAAYDRFVRDSRFHRIVPLVLVMLMILIMGKKALNAAAFLHPDAAVVESYSVPQTIAGSWQWMDTHLPPDATVVTNSMVSATYLTMFTSANPYLAQPINTLAPTAVLERRFASANKLLGATEEEMLARLADVSFASPADFCPEPCARDSDHLRDRSEFSYEFRPHAFLYGTTFSPRLSFDALTKSAAGTIPDDARARLRQYYRAYRPKPADFPLHTYVYIGPWERLLSSQAGDVFVKSAPVFANEDVRIYRLR